ncbi:type II toxin-antitoxin system PemK/MazF family toxin [Methylosarcina fibrata]|uniref:type II toxin-antitoxin system PemK/MazF family toxin n=1 Tax=Methylosarcina fibrata TaxID=105972 RepID=UPI000368D2D4|nr:type II toxin-antitoxin system PemK/MazF family toxin [Methylosarcina fibrata]
MKKGEIWWASLGEPRGSEPGFRRPVVVVSSNEFNNSKINTVLAAVITSNVRLADAPGNVLLEKKHSKLAKDSVINVSQIITLDKKYLTEKASKLSTQHINALNDGLKLVMGL